jgi:hypothetical protein
MADNEAASAQPANADNRVFHGREAQVLIGPALSTIDSSSTLDTQITGEDRSGILTEITLTDPEASVEVQNTFGGQVMTESPHDLVEIEFTARFQDISLVEELMGEPETTVTDTDTSNGEFRRIEGGTTIGNRPNKAILFRVEKVNPGTDTDNEIVNYLMNNAIFQQMGEISLAGDGAAEITGTALCRVADRFIEDNLAPSP